MDSMGNVYTGEVEDGKHVQKLSSPTAMESAAGRIPRRSINEARKRNCPGKKPFGLNASRGGTAAVSGSRSTAGERLGRATMKRLKTDKDRGEIGRRKFIQLGAASAVGLAASGAREVSAQTPDRPSHGACLKSRSASLSQLILMPLGARGLHESVDAGGRQARLDPLNFDLNRRVKWMDQRGMQTQVLTLNGGMPWLWVKPEDGVHLAQLCNDAAIKAHAAFPGRFLGASKSMPRTPLSL